MRVNQPNSSPAQSTGESSGAKRTGKAAAPQQAKGTDRPSGAEAPRQATGAATSEISSKAKDMAKAKSVATSAPDVREDRVAALKQRIAEGSYSVDAKAVAERMFDEHMGMGIG